MRALRRPLRPRRMIPDPQLDVLLCESCFDELETGEDGGKGSTASVWDGSTEILLKTAPRKRLAIAKRRLVDLVRPYTVVAFTVSLRSRGRSSETRPGQSR